MWPKIKMIYDSGDTKYPEDKIVMAPPIIAILDGYSPPHFPGMPKLLYNRTLGQAVVNETNRVFNQIKSAEKPLIETIVEANKMVKIFQLRKIDPGEFPGAGFAAVKINKESVEVIQGCDCLFLCILKDGGFIVSPNKYYQYDIKTERDFAEKMSLYRGDLKKSWKAHFLLLKQIRREHAQKDFSVLNGQDGILENAFVAGIPLSDIKLILLFTDGFLPIDTGPNQDNLAKYIIDMYGNGGAREGLQKILRKTRGIQEETQNTYQKFREASAIALRF